MTTLTKPTIQVKPLLAFHGNALIKENLLMQLRGHREADEIIRGDYWDGHRGCAVGCTVHSGNHADYEPLYGIPQSLAWIQDGIFEGLPFGEHIAFPEQFAQAIPVGADLSMVASRLMLRILTDPEHGVRQYAFDDGKAVIDRVAALYERRIAGEVVSRDDWSRAAYAADAAARAAAYAADAAAYAADAAARAAAYAADAAARAAAYAADAAARAAAYAAAYAAQRQWQRDVLLDLLASAPVPALTQEGALR